MLQTCSVYALLVYMHVHQLLGIHACTLVYMHFMKSLLVNINGYTHYEFVNIYDSILVSNINMHLQRTGITSERYTYVHGYEFYNLLAFN